MLTVGSLLLYGQETSDRDDRHRTLLYGGILTAAGRSGSFLDLKKGRAGS